MDLLEDDPLQAALATAFADSPIPHRRSASASASASSSSAPAVPEPLDITPETAAEGSDESWKEDLDRLSTSWRAESAVVREKAEQERERWRIIREKEEADEKERQRAVEAARREKESKETGWETVERVRKPQSKAEPILDQTGRRLSTAKEAASVVHDAPARHGLPSSTDARDLVSGETPGGHGIGTLESLLPRSGTLSSDYTASRPSHAEASVSTTAPPSNADDQALSTSRTWEEVPSLESSFPSLSFPERSTTASPEPREYPPQPPAPPSVTLAIFDPSLSARTRVLALMSSLAINMFLPFVNGVMLGFGEIFAKNIIGFFGWKIPGTAVGIHAAPRR